MLLVRVTAPPEGGKANAAVCRVIAKALRVGPSRVSVARGAGSSDKLLRIEGLEDIDLARLIARSCID